VNANQAPGENKASTGKPAAEPVKADPLQTRQVLELKHSSPLISCALDPSGRFAFAGGQDSLIQRWELATSKRTALAGHKSWVRALAFHPGDGMLFTGGYEGQVLAWRLDAEAPAPERTIDAHRGWVRALTVSPDGKQLATCGNDGLVKVWSTADGKPVREFAGHDCHVYQVAFHPNGQHLASTDLKGIVKHWDLTGGKAVRDLDAKLLHKYDPTFRADIGGARSMAFSPDGTLLACAGITQVTNAFAGVGKPVVVLFDWESGKVKQQLQPKENFQGTAWGVAFHREGFLVGAGGGSGGTLWFWKPDQPQAFHTLKLPGNARDLALHPDGLRLAVPFYENVLRIYEMTPKPAA
jgi:hypothetical protein